MKITGTFLDEITHDIPAANWGPAEWARDFDAMRAVGIDTVILIRAGYRDRTTFESETLRQFRPMRPAYLDLVDLFLREAERCGMDFYFGIYDSGEHWARGDYQQEIEINQRFTEEVIQKYGDRKAFKGWYLSHELHGYNEAFMQVYLGLTRHLRALKDMPLLMSPYVKGRKQFDDPITPEEHEKQWDTIFAQLAGEVDIVAFQDGQIDFLELAEFMAINKALADKHGLESWSNVETFERGMPINFLPINWQNLRYKLEAAETAGVEKLITFEFSHFLSPNSVYPSAHNLYRRYQEWLAETGQA
ncbi:MAG: Tat pathway signal protein [Anaerolineaceae bacterium]|nr:Tat pathway signal protein [Anaerolineaceae bacterium]